MSKISLAIELKANRKFKDNTLGGITLGLGFPVYVFSNGVVRVGEFLFPYVKAQHLIDHPWMDKVSEKTSLVVDANPSLDPELYEVIKVSKRVAPKPKKKAQETKKMNYKGDIDSDVKTVKKIADEKEKTESDLEGAEVEQRISLETKEDSTVVEPVKPLEESMPVNHVEEVSSLDDFSEKVKKSAEPKKKTTRKASPKKTTKKTTRKSTKKSTKKASVSTSDLIKK